MGTVTDSPPPQVTANCPNQRNQPTANQQCPHRCPPVSRVLNPFLELVWPSVCLTLAVLTDSVLDMVLEKWYALDEVMCPRHRGQVNISRLVGYTCCTCMTDCRCSGHEDLRGREHHHRARDLWGRHVSDPRYARGLPDLE